MKKTTERKAPKTAAQPKAPKAPKLPMPPKKIKARYAKRALESLSKTSSIREVARRVEAWARAMAIEKPDTFGKYRILSPGSLQRLANRLRRNVAAFKAEQPKGKMPSAFILGFQPKVRGKYKTRTIRALAAEIAAQMVAAGAIPGQPVDTKAIEEAAVKSAMAKVAASKKSAKK